jgi:hypothetical protein
MLDMFAAADYLAASEADVYRLYTWGEILGVWEGSDLRFRREDLDEYVFRKSRMTKWEYLFVEVQEERRVPRAATMNGEPLPDWKRGPSIYDFTAQLGEEGWELVGTHDTDKGVIVGLTFKRPVVVREEKSVGPSELPL